MLGAGIAEVVLPPATRNALAITFLAELIALWAFALAWIVAGKVIPALVDEDERLKLSMEWRTKRAEPRSTAY